MKYKETILISTAYHPKPGFEEAFVLVWSKKLSNLAYEMGAHMVGLYYNEESDEFLGTSHWSSKAVAEKFLSSPRLKLATDEINKFCLVPASREMFNILREAA